MLRWIGIFILIWKFKKKKNCRREHRNLDMRNPSRESWTPAKQWKFMQKGITWWPTHWHTLCGRQIVYGSNQRQYQQEKLLADTQILLERNGSSGVTHNHRWITSLCKLPKCQCYVQILGCKGIAAGMEDQTGLCAGHTRKVTWKPQG